VPDRPLACVTSAVTRSREDKIIELGLIAEIIRCSLHQTSAVHPNSCLIASYILHNISVMTSTSCTHLAWFENCISMEDINLWKMKLITLM
jgi:hypothetical protein